MIYGLKTCITFYIFKAPHPRLHNIMRRCYRKYTVLRITTYHVQHSAYILCVEVRVSYAPVYTGGYISPIHTEM